LGIPIVVFAMTFFSAKADDILVAVGVKADTRTDEDLRRINEKETTSKDMMHAVRVMDCMSMNQ